MSATIPSDERRRAPRRQPALGTFLRLNATDGTGKRLGLVWNISASGVSLLFNETVKAGEILVGELATERGAELPVNLRVHHVSKLQTGDYVLGCQFDHPLTADQIKPFVADLPLPA